MTVPSDPPAAVSPGAFKTWAQNVSDTSQDHDTRLDALESGASLTRIAAVDLSVAADPISFTSIPQTYRDLVVILSGTATLGAATVDLQLNGDIGANYEDRRLDANGSTVATSSTTAQTTAEIGLLNGTTLAAVTLELFNYTSGAHKVFASRSNLEASRLGFFAGVWRSTAAITSLSVAAGGSNEWTAGTVAALYGRGLS